MGLNMQLKIFGSKYDRLHNNNNDDSRSSVKDILKSAHPKVNTTEINLNSNIKKKTDKLKI